MPKKTKEAKEERKKVEKKAEKVAPKKRKEKETSSKKEVLKATNKKTPSKTTEKRETLPKKTKTRTRKTTPKTGNAKKETKAIIKETIEEYYDLPYRYNQTVVKVLAQTPSTLFVYWDISDTDKKKYIEQYGPYFFHNTKPVLIVHNKTKHYHFEVDINDFANSWYLPLVDSNCVYEIELGRRPINEYVSLPDNYLAITHSNAMSSPNDHILFEQLSHFVYFKNVKTNVTTSKNITSLSFLKKIGKLSPVMAFYQLFYPKEIMDSDRLDLRNPSSGNPTSTFK